MECPASIVDPRELWDPTAPGFQQPWVVEGLRSVVAALKMGFSVAPWLYESVNPFKAPPHHFEAPGRIE